MCASKVGETKALTPAVADLTSDGEVLLVVLDGLTGLPQGGVGEAQVAERVALTPTVAQSASGGHRGV